jgi:hypothetical protein
VHLTQCTGEAGATPSLPLATAQEAQLIRETAHETLPDQVRVE